MASGGLPPGILDGQRLLESRAFPDFLERFRRIVFADPSRGNRKHFPDDGGGVCDLLVAFDRIVMRVEIEAAEASADARAASAAFAEPARVLRQSDHDDDAAEAQQGTMEWKWEFWFAWVIASILVAILAKNRGHSGPGFFILSFVLSPMIGAIAVLALARLKKCPQCAERVRAEAKVCIYCGARLDAPAQTRPTKP